MFDKGEIHLGLCSWISVIDYIPDILSMISNIQKQTPATIGINKVTKCT